MRGGRVRREEERENEREREGGMWELDGERGGEMCEREGERVYIHTPEGMDNIQISKVSPEQHNHYICNILIRL